MKDIPKDIEETRLSWRRMAAIWRTAHYSLGTVGIICSVTAASWFLAAFGSPAWVAPLLSLLAALTFGLMAFLLPSEVSLSYRRALSLLEREILKYQHGDKYALKFVIDAKRDGEAIITNKNLVGEVPSNGQ